MIDTQHNIIHLYYNISGYQSAWPSILDMPCLMGTRNFPCRGATPLPPIFEKQIGSWLEKGVGV